LLLTFSGRCFFLLFFAPRFCHPPRDLTPYRDAVCFCSPPVHCLPFLTASFFPGPSSVPLFGTSVRPDILHLLLAIEAWQQVFFSDVSVFFFVFLLWSVLCCSYAQDPGKTSVVTLAPPFALLSVLSPLLHVPLGVPLFSFHLF